MPWRRQGGQLRFTPGANLYCVDFCFGNRTEAQKSPFDLSELFTALVLMSGYLNARFMSNNISGVWKLFILMGFSFPARLNLGPAIALGNSWML
jgi:hypothetical protein